MRAHISIKQARRMNEQGAVSLFVVIFAALFLTITTVGFVQTMLRLQQQAADNDLAQSAYDSAMAGVEDAKRAINVMKSACVSSPSGDECQFAQNILSEGACNSVKRVLGGSSDNSEVLIQRSESSDGVSEALNQAYTCVKVDLSPGSIKEPFSDDEGKLFKLSGVGDFDRVRISWGLQEGGDITFGSGLSGELPARDEWGRDTPALLRAQFIDHDGTFNTGDFDSDLRDGSASSTTTLLYPFDGGSGGSELELGVFEKRYDSSRAPSPVACDTAKDSYQCEATVRLANSSEGRSLYLYITSLYKGADVKIELFQGSPSETNSPIEFNNGYADVDSTGRANDLFRRVLATVKPRDDFPYPKAALEVGSDLCKDFFVTDDSYEASCVPGRENPTAP